MDHDGSGQVLPIIVMDLDINPTVSHLDKSKTIIECDFKNQLAIVALKSRCRTLTFVNDLSIREGIIYSSILDIIWTETWIIIILSVHLLFPDFRFMTTD